MNKAADNSPVSIAIAGAAGRMGQMLLREVLTQSEARLAGGLVRQGSDRVGRDIAADIGMDAGGAVYHDDALSLIASPDTNAIIDFTVKQSFQTIAELAAQSGKAYICGVTGLDTDDEAFLTRIARHCPVIYAANFSLGVILAKALARQAGFALGMDFDVEIVEMHHRHKQDSPSGTALALGRAVAEARAQDHDKVKRLSREGMVGPRPEGEIGYATLRGGDVVGEHEVIFAGPHERLIIGHRASNRAVFASGAVRAALWAARQDNGLYNMENVLGLKL